MAEPDFHAAFGSHFQRRTVNLKINRFRRGGSVRLGKLTWEFTAEPDPLSRAYSVLIEYQQGTVPQVYVLDPELGALAESRSLPHVYRQSPAQLCLCLPGSGEWSPSKRFSATIVPWDVLGYGTPRNGSPRVMEGWRLAPFAGSGGTGHRRR